MPKKTNDRAEETLYRIRSAIGYLALALPVVLIGIGLLRHELKPSMSEFYYTHEHDFFEATLFAIGGFLILYTGYPPDDKKTEFISDGWVSKLAGIAVLCVALIPMTPTNAPTTLPLRFLDLGLPTSVTEKIHYGAAAVFFSCLAVFSLVLFQRGPRDTAEDRARHDVYKVCGWAIVAVIATLGGVALTNWIRPNTVDMDAYNLTLIGETMAVVAFAASWLTKGRADLAEYTTTPLFTTLRLRKVTTSGNSAPPPIDEDAQRD